MGKERKQSLTENNTKGNGAMVSVMDKAHLDTAMVIFTKEKYLKTACMD